MVFPSVFAIVVGLGMIAQWAMSFVTKQIPELQSEPIRLGFHLAAEAMTALMLIAGGIGLMVGRSWAPVVYPTALGMLFYTAIVSPGYFAQRGRWTWVLVFSTLVLLAAVSLFVAFA